MPNNYFQFKQFRVEQGLASMKVTTEGCLLGALVKVTGSEHQILDIGTGTGLLSLMLAQRSGAHIDAIEIDHDAFHQARENFEQSPWSERLKAHHGSIQEYQRQPLIRYDLIISNPPFFQNHLKSGKARDQAIHNDELSFGDLAKAVSTLLKDDGKFWVIYPGYEFQEFMTVAGNHGLKLIKKYEVFDRPTKPLFRNIGVFGFDDFGRTEEEELFIKASDGKYSPRFREVIREYYFNL